MYKQTNLLHKPIIHSTNSKFLKSSSSNFKRKTSDHIPLLNSTNLPKKSPLNNKIKRKIHDYDYDKYEYDAPTSNYASVRKQQTQPSIDKRTKTDSSIISKKKTLPEDGSVRLVTSTIQGMKHWTNKQLPYPILFEIFGQLDSQITHLPSRNARQFSLIDENDRIECVFSEIDQTLINIDRDVQLRTICRLEYGSNIVHCFAIRVANKNEWNERRLIIKQCDLQLNEDDLNSKKFKKNNKK